MLHPSSYIPLQAAHTDEDMAFVSIRCIDVYLALWVTRSRSDSTRPGTEVGQPLLWVKLELE